MAKARRNILIREVSGGIGGFVLRQMPDGSTYISAKPDFSRRKFSADQEQHQKRFKMATMYAKEAAKREPIYAKLAEGTVKSPYNIALSDWFHAPVIHAIERRDGGIWVRASDNVMVSRVEVTVSDAAGFVLAQGLAVAVQPTLWMFETAAVGRITVKAWDLAKNVTVRGRE